VKFSQSVEHYVVATSVRDALDGIQRTYPNAVIVSVMTLEHDIAFTTGALTTLQKIEVKA
jgi:hypothetical protein